MSAQPQTGSPGPTEVSGPAANRWLILAIVAIAQFMIVLDATIVNVALPDVQEDLGFSASSLQWIVSGYTLFFGGFLLLGGRAADLVGRQWVFLAGLVVFTGASLINGLAQSSDVLIAGRLLQGLGAALLSPAALSIVTTTFTEGKDRTRALGIWSAISAGGGAVGLLAGGALTDGLSWRWIFFINLPVGIAAAVIALRMIPNTRARNRPAGVDLAGAVSVTGGLLLLVYTIVEAEGWGWGSGRTLGLGATALAMLAAFVLIELRSKAPLVRLGIFRQRALSVANVAIAGVLAALLTMFYFVSLYLQQIQGYSALETGAAFVPSTVAIVVGAILAETLLPRIGLRYVLYAGLAITAAGLGLSSMLPAQADYLSDIFPGFVLFGVGLGLVFTPLTMAATTGVRDDDAGLASGLFQTFQQIGGALGLAVLSTLAANRTSNTLGDLGRDPTGSENASALIDGYQLALTVSAGLMVAVLAFVVVLLRSRDVPAAEAGVSLTAESGPVPVPVNS